MKIAWGITGAGHYLRESVEIITKLVEDRNHVEIFISAAGEIVLKMYGLLSKLVNLFEKEKENYFKIHYDREQSPGYPICAQFNLHHYDILILSPVTSNSVAKMNIGIADTLITNIFAQMIKGMGKIFILPCDLVAGEILTEIPDGKSIIIHVDEFNSQNAKNLKKFPRVSIYQKPKEIYQELTKILINQVDR